MRGPDFEVPHDAEIAFLTIHGTFGEDGQIQQILEERGIAYTGDGVEESRLAFDKILSKERFRAHGVATPESEVIRIGARPSMQVPLVIKVPRDGSTVGRLHCEARKTRLITHLRMRSNTIANSSSRNSSAGES